MGQNLQGWGKKIISPHVPGEGGAKKKKIERRIMKLQQNSYPNVDIIKELLHNEDCMLKMAKFS